MKHEKNSLLIIGTLLAILSLVGRFSILGWLGLFGLLSIIIFGPMQMSLLKDVRRYFEFLSRFRKRLAWWAVFVFPIIFLFQFDFRGDTETRYAYHYLIGKRSEWIENNAFFLALLASFVYLVIFIEWKIGLKKIKSKLN